MYTYIYIYVSGLAAHDEPTEYIGLFSSLLLVTPHNPLSVCPVYPAPLYAPFVSRFTVFTSTIQHLSTRFLPFPFKTLGFSFSLSRLIAYVRSPLHSFLPFSISLNKKSRFYQLFITCEILSWLYSYIPVISYFYIQISYANCVCVYVCAKFIATVIEEILYAWILLFREGLRV